MQDSVAESIENKVRQQLQPVHLDLVNDSHRHAGPATDSHYNLTLVSEEFAGLSAVKRHQLVYRLVQAEMDGPVHALALHLYTPAEWERRGMKSVESPDCRGGSK